LVGRNLQKEYGQEPQAIIMMPLLEGLDGVNKMSKSLYNYIGIDDKPNDIYGKLMSLPDDLIVRYFELLTDVSQSELKEIKNKLNQDNYNPMNLKKRLAREIVSEYYNEKEAQQAQKEFQRVFSRGKKPEDIPEIDISAQNLENGEMWIVKLVAATGLVDSNSQARRMIKQGAVKINDKKYDKINIDIKVEKDMVIQIGKRRFAKINII
jgi:tyrosyl-tRNA synthetase